MCSVFISLRYIFPYICLVSFLVLFGDEFIKFCCKFFHYLLGVMPVYFGLFDSLLRVEPNKFWFHIYFAFSFAFYANFITFHYLFFKYFNSFHSLFHLSSLLFLFQALFYFYFFFNVLDFRLEFFIFRFHIISFSFYFLQGVRLFGVESTTSIPFKFHFVPSFVILIIIDNICS